MDPNLTCPDCAAQTEAHSRYCEACGVLLPRPPTSWWCQVCGRAAPIAVRCGCGSLPSSGASRVSSSPVDWLGGVSDIGRRAATNDDALALAAPHPDLGIIAIADGVGSTAGSWLAAKVAVDTACQVLVDDHMALDRAVRSARVGVRALDGSACASPGYDSASCTLSLAVVERGVTALRISVSTVGDSRVYWLPDDPEEPALQLSVDDRVVAGPASRERLDGGPGGELDARPGAEADAAAADSSQAITAWIGPDAPASRPHQGTWEVTRPGWLLACTDGLWNYLCDPQALRTALRDDSADGLGVTDRHDPGDGDPTPQTLADTVAGPSALALASALVARANDLGGRDNITVALARWDHDTSAGRRPALETTR